MSDDKFSREKQTREKQGQLFYVIKKRHKIQDK